MPYSVCDSLHGYIESMADHVCDMNPMRKVTDMFESQSTIWRMKKNSLVGTGLQ